METMRVRGCVTTPFGEYPSSSLPIITLACVLSRPSLVYIVTTAATVFFEGWADVWDAAATPSPPASIWRRFTITGPLFCCPRLDHLPEPSSSPLDRDVDHGLAFCSRGQSGIAGELFFLHCRFGVLDLQVRFDFVVIDAFPVDSLGKG